MIGNPRHHEDSAYLDDDTYIRRRRRRITALITVGAAFIVAIDVTTAIQWAIGARSATDSITTLVMTAAMVVAVTWHVTHPTTRIGCWPMYEGSVIAAGALTSRGERPGTTQPGDGESPTTDEGEQR